MKVIRKEEADILNRPYGRQTYLLFSHRFDQPIDSIIFYLSELPTGQLDEHYHTRSEELIFFPEGGAMRVNGEIVKLGPWDGVFLEPGDKHGLELKDKPTVHLAIKMPDVSDKKLVE